MESFKLYWPKRAAKCHSCTQQQVDKFFDYLLKGTYIMCSCLIVYSLLLLHLMFIADLSQHNVVAQAPIITTPNPFFAFYANPIKFLDDTNQAFIDSALLIHGGIKNINYGLTALFIQTGHILSSINILLPNYAMAKAGP